MRRGQLAGRGRGRAWALGPGAGQERKRQMPLGIAALAPPVAGGLRGGWEAEKRGFQAGGRQTLSRRPHCEAAKLSLVVESANLCQKGDGNSKGMMAPSFSPCKCSTSLGSLCLSTQATLHPGSIWSRAEKLLCLCSLGTHWKLYSDVFWDLVWPADLDGNYPASSPGIQACRRQTVGVLSLHNHNQIMNHMPISACQAGYWT
ncbi:macrophage immunometabolism regulator isoform X2 [Equus quagga]|uniref:macrophage immunometabolism regulator isoform X2 n=1 Tax=Equus quagga TaxID=89248 RepID=UPI001EE1FC6B|nr:macrophage immunometabolism regulator isoform X2 [Equus quagga]XP_046524095.1 macrophage immunometabolism regulator isoform X2 [Equus quagga]